MTALAFVAAIDDPSRIRRSRDVYAYLGLVPRRYQSGEADYVGSISKCGDRRVRVLLHEAANVMLTRAKGRLKLKDWASRSPGDQRCAKRESLMRAVPRDHHLAQRDAARRDRVRIGLSRQSTRQEAESSSQEPTPEGGSRRRRGFQHAVNPWSVPISTGAALHPALLPSSAERARRERRHPESVDTLKSLSPLDPLENDCADFAHRGQPMTDSDFKLSRAAPSLPHQVPNEHAENAGTRKRRHPKSLSPLDPLENPLENNIRAMGTAGIDDVERSLPIAKPR